MLHYQGFGDHLVQPVIHSFTWSSNSKYCCVPGLHTSKLRPRDVLCPAQGHTAVGGSASVRILSHHPC